MHDPSPVFSSEHQGVTENKQIVVLINHYRLYINAGKSGLSTGMLRLWPAFRRKGPPLFLARKSTRNDCKRPNNISIVYRRCILGISLKVSVEACSLSSREAQS